MKLSSSNIEKFLIFSQNFFLYLRKREPWKKNQENSGNGTFIYFRKLKLQKTSNISRSNFPSSKT